MTQKSPPLPEETSTPTPHPRAINTTHRLPSLYGHLQRWITGAVCLGGACLLVATYFFQLDEVHEISNENLKQIALAAALQVPSSTPLTLTLPQNLPRFLEEDDGQNFVTQVFNPQGQLLHSSTPDIRLPAGSVTGLREADINNQNWYLYTIITPNGIAVAGQNGHLRQLIVRATAGKLVLVLAVLLVFMGLLVHWALRRGLKPLQHVADAIATRSADSLAPLTVDDYPREIQTIIHALNQLMARLEQALHAQQRFIADAAHELRTPVTALRLQLQLLQRATAVERRQQAEHELAQGIARVERLVLQLLDLSRVEPQAQQHPKTIPVDLHTLCEDVITRYRLPAQHKNIALHWEDHASTASNTPRLMGDPTSLGMLVSNLVDNAIRYTPAQGHVMLELEARDAYWELVVQDSGPGIALAEHPRVFDRFYRINPVHSAPDDASEVGSGIGLAIVQQAVQLHHGHIALGTSRWGGLRVTVQLPYSSAA